MANQKILIIDDDPDIVEAMRMPLEANAYNVLTASNGEEGLQRVKAEIPDLVILDVMMETDTEGFNVQKLEDKLGIKGSSTAQIHFDNVKVPKENILGEFERGFKVALATLDGGRIGIAAQALGIAEGAFRYARMYATQRVQFGKSISNLQAIQFKIADMSTKIHAARLMIDHASELKDAGQSYSKEAAQAKLFASEAAMWITTQAIQVLGGNGYINEFPAGRLLRDAKLYEIGAGTSEIRRMLIGRELFNDSK